MMFPESVKAALVKCAQEGKYTLALEILQRGTPDTLELHSDAEAQVIVNIARVEMMRAVLTYPFWSDSDPRHDPAHEAVIDDVLHDVFEKTASYIGQEFHVTTST